jgi:hypothetical protein
MNIIIRNNSEKKRKFRTIMTIKVKNYFDIGTILYMAPLSTASDIEESQTKNPLSFLII